MDNALVHQKDMILKLINEGEFEEALNILEFSKELWKTCTYGYKYRELKERIREEVRHNLFHTSHWKSKQRWSNLLERVA